MCRFAGKTEPRGASFLNERGRVSYVKNFKTHILPALGKSRLDVTRDQMIEFVKHLAKKPPRTKKKTAEEGTGSTKPEPPKESKTPAKDTIKP